VSDVTKFTLSFRVGDASLTLRADTVTELEAMATQAEASPVCLPFFGKVVLPKPNSVTKMVENVDKLVAEKKAEAATGLTGDEAQAAVAKHLGAGEELASPNQIVAAAKKSGKTAEELAGISVNEAKRLIAAGKGK
jgi:hypothetical protein